MTDLQTDYGALTIEELESLARAFVAANRAEFLDCTADDVISAADPDLPILGAVVRIVAAREARAAYFAMWRFFLSLPSPTPFSDMVQREAMRLSALCAPSIPPGTTKGGDLDA